ncbi:MAG: hypothetical protein K0S37_747 [Microbacterium sp.]|nr:hypothetical protein [Microbacterium sp.]
MNTLPNGVKTPTGSDLVEPRKLLADLADSFSDALGGLGTGKRQPRTFRVENQTEKTALAGLTTLQDGDRCFVADTAWWEQYVGTSWKLWQTTKAIAWPIAHTGLTVGNGVSNFSYMVNGDEATLTGSFVFGSSSAFTTNAGTLVLPFPLAYATQYTVLGNISVNQNDAYFYLGLAIANTTLGTSAARLLIDSSTANGILVPLGASAPTAWAAGSTLGINLRWRRTV